jgi:hypothetical protein
LMLKRKLQVFRIRRIMLIVGILNREDLHIRSRILDILAA